jgi:hypothetical protein
MSLDNFTPVTDFGIYCYRDNATQWHIQIDHNLLSPEQKSVLINRALMQKEYRFFYCDLTATKNVSIEQEQDLEQQLSRLRRHNPHHLHLIRSMMKSLFAVCDLTDITPIIEAVYQA